MGVLTSAERTDRRPIHYSFKIKPFSLLAKNNIQRYKSGEFKVGGYKWKVILHPNGNKSKNVDDHISLYLKAVVDKSSVQPGWEVHATFKFFLHDQINDNFLVIQDEVKSGRRFHGLKLEWGIDRVISLKDFLDPVHGFVVNDTCVFGVEVYVFQVTGDGEYFSMITDPTTYKHTWKIDNFSSLVGYEESAVFRAGGHKWKIWSYPKGDRTIPGNFLALYLGLVDEDLLGPSTRILAKYTLSILDQVNGKNVSMEGTDWFRVGGSSWGWNDFISLSDLNSTSSGFLRDGVCVIVEAEVTVLGVVKAL